MIIKRLHQFIGDSRKRYRQIQDFLCTNDINHPYAGHRRSSVKQSDPLTEMNIEWSDFLFFKNFGSRLQLPINQHLSLTYQIQRKMSELNQITTSPNTTSLKYASADSLVQQTA